MPPGASWELINIFKGSEMSSSKLNVSTPPRLRGSEEARVMAPQPRAEGRSGQELRPVWGFMTM